VGHVNQIKFPLSPFLCDERSFRQLDKLERRGFDVFQYRPTLEATDAPALLGSAGVALVTKAIHHGGTEATKTIFSFSCLIEIAATGSRKPNQSPLSSFLCGERSFDKR
jgi:hypothetical protein